MTLSLTLYGNTDSFLMDIISVCLRSLVICSEVLWTHSCINFIFTQSPTTLISFPSQSFIYFSLIFYHCFPLLFFGFHSSSLYTCLPKIPYIHAPLLSCSVYSSPTPSRLVLCCGVVCCKVAVSHGACAGCGPVLLCVCTTSGEAGGGARRGVR